MVQNKNKVQLKAMRAKTTCVSKPGTDFSKMICIRGFFGNARIRFPAQKNPVIFRNKIFASKFMSQNCRHQPNTKLNFLQLWYYLHKPCRFSECQQQVLSHQVQFRNHLFFSLEVDFSKLPERIRPTFESTCLNEAVSTGCPIQ